MAFRWISSRISESWRQRFSTVNRILLRPTIFLKARPPISGLLLPTAIGIVRAATSPDQIDLKDHPHLIHHADHLFDGNKFVELYNLLLPYKESGEVDLSWRFARATYKLSSEKSSKKLELLTEGYEVIKKALELHPNSALANKWMAILLDAYSEALSFRERCKNIVPVKDYMMKSAELDSSDPTVWYMLGVWFYEMADLSWYKIKILNAVGGVAPQSSYEEALKYFEKAEQTEPNFYSLNHLMLGKCYLKLRNQEKAVKYFKKTAECVALTDDDVKARKEATDMLKHLKM